MNAHLHRLGGALLVLALGWPTRALAAPNTEPTESVPRSSPGWLRGSFLFGIATPQAHARARYADYDNFNLNSDRAASPVLALGFDFGVAVARDVTVKLRGQVGTNVNAQLANLYVVGEWIPHPRWSFGGGLGAEAMDFLLWDFCIPWDSSSDCQDHILSWRWQGLSVPILLTYHFRNDIQGSWRITLEAALGADPRDFSDWGAHESFMFSYEWM